MKELARVLRPGSLWFFQTDNRTPCADGIAIRALEQFVANVQDDLQVRRLFITPDEPCAAASSAGLSMDELFRMRPALDSAGLAHRARIALTGRVSPSFRFVLTSSLAVGYLGCGTKQC